jgi:polyisoprenoid-binding protein YceI
VKTSLVLALGLAALAVRPARAVTFRVDPAYSAVRVSLRHYLFFHPVVTFEKVEGTFDYEAGKPEAWKASVKVAASSVNSGKASLDRKLASPRYFDAAGHPEISFASEKTSVGKDGRITMAGVLTIKGVSHPAKFQLEVDGPIVPELDGRMGLSAHGVISRSLWNIPAGLFFGDKADVTVLLQGAPSFP